MIKALLLNLLGAFLAVCAMFSIDFELFVLTFGHRTAYLTFACLSLLAIFCTIDAFRVIATIEAQLKGAGNVLAQLGLGPQSAPVKAPPTSGKEEKREVGFGS